MNSKCKTLNLRKSRTAAQMRAYWRWERHLRATDPAAYYRDVMGGW